MYRQFSQKTPNIQRGMWKRTIPLLYGHACFAQDLIVVNGPNLTSGVFYNIIYFLCGVEYEFEVWLLLSPDPF